MPVLATQNLQNTGDNTTAPKAPALTKNGGSNNTWFGSNGISGGPLAMVTAIMLNLINIDCKLMEGYKEQALQNLKVSNMATSIEGNAIEKSGKWQAASLYMQGADALASGLMQAGIAVGTVVATRGIDAKIGDADAEQTKLTQLRTSFNDPNLVSNVEVGEDGDTEDENDPVVQLKTQFLSGDFSGAGIDQTGNNPPVLDEDTQSALELAKLENPDLINNRLNDGIKAAQNNANSLQQERVYKQQIASQVGNFASSVVTAGSKFGQAAFAVKVANNESNKMFGGNIDRTATEVASGANQAITQKDDAISRQIEIMNAIAATVKV